MTSANSPVELIEVSKTFGDGIAGCTAVHDVTLRLTPGELVLLLGPSGSGKTTLLSLMSGLIKPTTGMVRLFGREIRSCNPAELQQIRAGHLGFVFQTFLLIDSLTAIENISLVLCFAGCTSAAARQRSRELLASLDISHLEQKFPAELSHGERQRVAIARAMANSPSVIFADEPTASLDSQHGTGVIHLLSSYARRQHACVIVASHDLRITHAADRILRLEDGCLSDSASVSDSSYVTQEI